MKRKAISKKDQFIVWSRDQWCCRYCGRPVIFAPSMKLLEKLSPGHGYYHAHWKRVVSPLLDELGATVDHIHAVSRGGVNSLDNYHTACSKCNLKKNNQLLENWGDVKESLPTNWDGLSSLFLVTYKPEGSDSTDKQWFNILNNYPPEETK